MNDPGLWQKNNDEYLAKSLAWLRLRLARTAQQYDEAKPARAAASSSGQPESQSFNWRFWVRSSATSDKARPHLLPPAPANVTNGVVTDEEIAKAAAEMSAAEAVTPPPALAILSRSFGLSRFEQEILLFCAAMELDTRIASSCARAQDDPVRPYPTFALAMALFDDPAWDALSPEGPLRHWRLIEINQPGAQPLVTSALRADERIVNFLKGLNYLDDRLAPLFLPAAFDGMEAPLPPSQQSAVETMLRQLKQAGATQQLPVVQLAGSDAPSKQMIALRTASALGLRLYRLPVELMPAHAVGAEVRLYDNLFTKEDPNEVEEGQDFTANLNPNSLEVLSGCKVEPSLRDAAVGARYQFERMGYFCVDPASASGKLVFNRTIGLRDTWAKIEQRAKK